MKVVRDAYQANGKDKLQILPAETGEELGNSFKNWLAN
jgi:hypothetical protein